MYLIHFITFYVLVSSTVACNSATTTTSTTTITTTATTTITTTTPFVVKPCQDVMNKGNCSNSFNSFPRYYYNHTEAKCFEFTYSGCGGNLNNFVSQNECEVMCLNATKNEENVYSIFKAI